MTYLRIRGRVLNAMRQLTCKQTRETFINCSCAGNCERELGTCSRVSRTHDGNGSSIVENNSRQLERAIETRSNDSRRIREVPRALTPFALNICTPRYTEHVRAALRFHERAQCSGSTRFCRANHDATPGFFSWMYAGRDRVPWESMEKAARQRQRGRDDPSMDVTPFRATTEQGTD